MRIATEIIVILFSVFSFIESQRDEGLITQTPNGKLQGRVLQSLDGSDYYAYQEIPYASPPVGDYRFKEARKPEPWEGIRDATKNTKICFQLAGVSTQLEQSEDCLYLNVYTPVNPNITGYGIVELLPVLVYVHGGGFALGSGSYADNGPKYLMDHGIVVVTINYRLGPLGFLNTMDGIIPGNLGLKDLRLALQWIQENIEYFGGDPEKVTISGESAGAFSVSFQLLGKNSIGLFRAVIQESGSAICRSAFTSNARRYAFDLGAVLDSSLSSQNSSEDLLQVLLNANVSDLVSASSDVANLEEPSDGYTINIRWSVVIENGTDPGALITEPMLHSFLYGKFQRVPILLGFNSEESIYFKAISNLTFQEELARSYDEDPSILVDSKLRIGLEFSGHVGTELKKIYTSSNFSDDNGAYARLSTDAGFTNAIIKQAELASQYVPVYLYQFSHLGVFGQRYYTNGTRPWAKGAEKVGHVEELAYLWEYALYKTHEKYGEDSSDLTTVRRMTKMWTNFVKYLDPTPDIDETLDGVIWPNVSGSILPYLNMNDTLGVEYYPRYYKEVDDLLWRFVKEPLTCY